MNDKINSKTTVQELLAIIYQHLTENNISAVVTGGTVVSVYTDNKYESLDIDLISPSEQKELMEVMAKIGFHPTVKDSKDLAHKSTAITIEFPGRSVILGGRLEKVDHEQVVEGVRVKMLSPTQSVQDRLEAYIAWKDIQGLEQAEWICEKQPVSLDRIKAWSKSAGANTEQMNEIIKRCERGIKKRKSS